MKKGWIESAQLRLEAARSLHANGFYNGAVSRGFFAMLHAAHALLARHEYNAKTYSGAFSLLHRHLVPDSLPLSLFRDLGRMRLRRERADYSLRAVEEENAALCLEVARLFVDHVREEIA